MTSSSDPSRRHLLVGAGVGAAAVAIGALPALAGRAGVNPTATSPARTSTSPSSTARSSSGFVKIYGLAIETGLFDDEQTALAVQFLNHHQEHSAAAGAVGGVGVVSVNQRLVNTYTGRVRTATTVDVLANVLFELESRAASTYSAAWRHLPRTPGRRPRCCNPLDRVAACDRARASGEPSDRSVDPAVRVRRRRVHAGRVSGAAMSDELRRQMRDASSRNKSRWDRSATRSCGSRVATLRSIDVVCSSPAVG